MIINWPESKDAGMSPEQEVKRAEEAPPYNELPEEKRYALFTDGSCCIVGKHDDGRLRCGIPHDEPLKVLRDKVNRANSQR